MDLRVAGVREERALAVRTPDRGGVRALGIRRQVEDVAVAAGSEDDRVGDVGRDVAGDEVAHDDAARPPLDDDELEHLVADELLHRASRHLPLQRLVGAEQELLPGLTARVERAGDERTAEGAVRERAAVLAGERHALGDALIDDVHRHLGEAVDVRLAGAEVAALDGVVEQALHRVAVVLVALRGVDAALRGDRMRAAGRVLEAEVQDLEPELTQGRRRGAAGEAGAHDDDPVLSLVRRVDELHVELVLLPLALDGPRRDFGVERHVFVHPTRPTMTASGTAENPSVRITAAAIANFWIVGEMPRLLMPSDWNIE